MTISVWRFSHLALAVSSFLFIALASITGFILAFQPISEEIPSYKVHDFDKITLAETIPALKQAYPGISDISINDNQFLSVKGTDAKKKKLLAYADPRTGKILGVPGKPNEFFQWVTALHRSLFLHELGRLFVGITAFLLLLIAISGAVLVIRRQRGFKRFFTRVVKEDFAAYYHVVLGRLSLVPIILIALTGTYLSLARFGFFPEKKIKHRIDVDSIKSVPEKPLASFPVFKHILLSQVETIEFPFSDFPEDYYTLKLKDREIVVNQFTGEVLSEVHYPVTTTFTNLSLNLHTGRTSVIWAIILAIASINILFFIYSGFVITIKRRTNRTKNKYTSSESNFIILVGSENGSTFRYAKHVHNQLLKQGKKSFLTELNSYTTFPNATHLIIMTATYGLGDAPNNAIRFADLIFKYPQNHEIRYAVLGFGSHAYPDYCRFAFEANKLMAEQKWAVPLIDIHTVNDKSPDDFNLWVEAFSQQTDIEIDLLKEALPPDSLNKLKVISNTTTDSGGNTFLLRLKSADGLKITSGDLLAIYPANDHRERLYSVGIIGEEIQLSVRLHANGLGSEYLHNLKPGQTLPARMVSNSHFHFPKQAKTVVMIANGTGIAPFLGMINQNKEKTPIHLYLGLREQASFSIYQDFLNEQKAAGKLQHLNLVLSRENTKQYVSDLLAKDSQSIAEILRSGGVLMICGSLNMQRDVMKVLENICGDDPKNTLSFYQSHSQILTDCY